MIVIRAGVDASIKALKQFKRGGSRRWRAAAAFLLSAALLSSSPLARAQSQDLSGTQVSVEDHIQRLIPGLETYIQKGMNAFDVPGVAVGIVANNRLIYGKGFGVRSKDGGSSIDTRTVFQIGSTTKAFLATTMAIMVDRGKLRWDDRIVDLDPDFQLKDPWVTREFRAFDVIAQRSGLPPYANDGLGFFGMDEAGLIRSLRNVDPVSSFRSTFAYTNITHLLAGRVVAKAAGAPDGDTVLRQELLDPLGMRESSYTAAAIQAAPNHAEGHRWTPNGTVEVPFSQMFPYDFGGAGDINSTVEDMSRWVRLQLGNGTFDGRRLVSADSLAFTRTPKVALSDKVSYAMGWIVQQTRNGSVIWHNGGTNGFGAFVGTQPDRDVGVVVLTNAQNMGYPESVGLWLFDRILGNPDVDYAAESLKRARASHEAAERLFDQPKSPRPFPPVAPLAGTFSHPSIGKAMVVVEGDELVMQLQATGARLRLKPWDGEVLTAKLMPLGRFAAIVANLGPLPNGFVQFQIDKDAKPNVLRLTLDDGQAYEFRRE